jgi:hypothetical protein
VIIAPTRVSVLWVPLGGAIETIATGLASAPRLVADETGVFVGDHGASSGGAFSDGRILALGPDLGSPQVLADGIGEIGCLALDATSVYWRTCGMDRPVHPVARWGA